MSADEAFATFPEQSSGQQMRRVILDAEQRVSGYQLQEHDINREVAQCLAEVARSEMQRAEAVHSAQEAERVLIRHRERLRKLQARQLELITMLRREGRNLSAKMKQHMRKTPTASSYELPETDSSCAGSEGTKGGKSSDIFYDSVCEQPGSMITTVQSTGSVH